MTENKWRSPTGHSIASHVTDKMTDTQKLTDVIEYVENALFLYGARAYYLPEHIELVLEAAKSTLSKPQVAGGDDTLEALKQARMDMEAFRLAMPIKDKELFAPCIERIDVVLNKYGTKPNADLEIPEWLETLDWERDINLLKVEFKDEIAVQRLDRLGKLIAQLKQGIK